LRPPLVYNGLADPVEVRASWSDGSESSGSIGPRAAAHLGRPDARLRSLVVSRNGTPVAEFGESDLLALSTNPEVIGMAIDANGAHAITEEQLARMRAAE
jgi:hypothetical protein